MTRMGTAALLRELLFKTRRYMEDKENGKNPAFDMKLEAMIPVLRGELPLKAHAGHEPVIPPCSRQVVCVVGLSGLHGAVQETVHRPEIFCRLTGCRPEDEVTAELAAKGLLAEHLADTFFLNQAESDLALQDAEIMASLLKKQGWRVVAGSQWERIYHAL